MKYLKIALALAVLALALVAISACGGGSSQAISLNDVPAYPNTTPLKPGENPMADTLAQNVQTAANMGSKLDQKIFKLQAGANWDQIKSFYGDKLSGSGWQAINLPIPANEMTQMAVWKRGGQSLTVIQLSDPVSQDMFLVFSLSSQ